MATDEGEGVSSMKEEDIAAVSEEVMAHSHNEDVDVDDCENYDDDHDEENEEHEVEEDDDEAPNTPTGHSTTPIHIQPYYSSYHHVYYPPYPTDYTLTGPINPHVYTDASAIADPTADTCRNRGGVTEPFPEKMHRMLEGTEREGLTDVVSFFSHGRAFAIHKPRRFVAEVMLRYFRQTRLTSFQRQLNLYGFRRISQGPDNGGYYHELFLKGRPGLCVNMKRTKVKGAAKHRRDPESEPNFYAMRPITGAAPPHPSTPSVLGYHGYPAYPYFPPYTAAQTGGYSYAPYYYPHWGYAPPQSPPEATGTPGGDSQEGDDEDKNHNGEETPVKNDDDDDRVDDNDDDGDEEEDDDDDDEDEEGD